MVSGHDKPFEASDTHATAGTPLLSASSVMSSGSGAGTIPMHSTLTFAGAVPVGLIGSVINTSCVTKIWLPQSSVTL